MSLISWYPEVNEYGKDTSILVKESNKSLRQHTGVGAIFLIVDSDLRDGGRGVKN